MKSLHQIIALVADRKPKAQKILTDVHRGWTPERLNGMTRVYTPKDDDGDKFPSESKKVQLRVKDEVRKVRFAIEDFFILVASQEYGNTFAKADIELDDSLIASKVPVATLLFLEKQLVNIRTMIKNIPTLAVDKEWKLDEAKNCWTTEPEETIKTRKVPKAFVKYEATKEHPAQVDTFTVDERIGNWSTVHLSGAMKEKDKEEMLVRVERLQAAVKIARSKANSHELDEQDENMLAILDYIFGK